MRKVQKYRALLQLTIAGVAWLSAAACFATETTTLEGQSQTTLESPTRDARWTIEGALQAQSVAGPASPWLGIGASLRLFNSVNFGLRGFVPLSQTVDNSTYAIQAPLRFRLYQGAKTDFLFEGEYAVNFYNFIPFTSFGLAVGAINRYSPGLSFGVLGGIELAQVVIDSIGLETRNDLIVYPKIALVVDFGL